MTNVPNAHLYKEKQKRADNISIDQSTTGIRSIPQIPRNRRRLRRTTQKKMRKITSKEDLHRIRLIVKSSLSPSNKTKAINQLAVPVFQYSCAIIGWPQLEINNRDTKTRKFLTIHTMFYKNQCIPRLYLPRRRGGEDDLSNRSGDDL